MDVELFSPSLPSASPPSLVLRSSCDSCAVSKVKCDKSHPRCGRCAASGMECVYGVSRKHGRGNAKRLREHDDDGTTAANASRILRARMSCDSSSTTGSISNAECVAWHPATSSSSSTNPESYPCSQEKAPRAHSLSIDHAPFEPRGSTPFQPPLGSSSKLYDLRGIDESSPGHLTPPLDLTAFNIDIFGTPFLNAGVEPRPQRRKTEPTSPIPLPSETPPDCWRSRSCSAKAREMLTDLSHQQSRLDSNGSVNPEQILMTNREAIQSIVRWLECLHCSRDTHSIMLGASVMALVLRLYQAASRMKPTTAPSPPETNGQPFSPPWSSDGGLMSIHDGDALTHLITMDDLDLDDQDQETMRRLLFLSELRKAARLVDRFASKSLRTETELDRTGDLYMMLGMWLRKEVAQTMREMRDD